MEEEREGEEDEEGKKSNWKIIKRAEGVGSIIKAGKGT